MKNDDLPQFRRVTLTGGLDHIDRQLAQQGEKLKPFRCTVPEGSKGRWSIRHFQVREGVEQLRLVRDGGRGMAPGQYTKLLRDAQTIVMSDTDAEIIDFIEAMRPITGRVLIGGLGLGLAVKALLLLDTVTYIEVVEIDQDVIDLVGPHVADPRLRIVRNDIFRHNPMSGHGAFDWAWYDIWDEISDSNLPAMRRLRTRYKTRMIAPRRQLCWAEVECRKMAKGISPRNWY